MKDIFVFAYICFCVVDVHDICFWISLCALLSVGQATNA
uniref:Uncharacterized protein n=1 Tax=Arundo donax TaxID=35708 RepID=A0A0A9B4K1_ARUDO